MRVLDVYLSGKPIGSYKPNSFKLLNTPVEQA